MTANRTPRQSQAATPINTHPVALLMERRIPAGGPGTLGCPNWRDRLGSNPGQRAARPLRRVEMPSTGGSVSCLSQWGHSIRGRGHRTGPSGKQSPACRTHLRRPVSQWDCSRTFRWPGCK
jgi:hypothetical protein